jgi:hypothetical protein
VDEAPAQVALDERRGFQRAPDGRIEVRRAFGSDAIAFLLSVVVPVIYLIVVVLLVALIIAVLPDGPAASAVGR